MRGLAAALSILAALAACQNTRPTYEEPEPEWVDPPQIPPERIIRLPVNYTFKDPGSTKRYFLRMYQEGDFADDVVTVLEPGRAYERMATQDEFDYAMSVFIGNWVNAGEAEQLRIHRELYSREWERKATQIDDLILNKEREIARLETERFDLNADVVSSEKISDYKAPAGRLEFRKAELARMDARIAGEKSELHLLKYRRYLRDQGADIARLRSLLE